MRGVGDESALRFHGFGHPDEQAVDGAHEGPDFARQVAAFDRTQVGVRASVHLLGEFQGGTEHAADDVGDGDQQNGHQEEEGRERSQGVFERSRVAQVRVLGDDDALVGREGADEDSKGPILDVQSMQAIRQRGWNRNAGAGGMKAI
ncbi:hypothetical protein CDEF62S_01806 [Castellaniella defragrans]